MSRTPNYELLKDAYAIIGGIPNNVVYLNVIERQRGASLDCGTICCGMGWLSHHPQFQQLGLAPAPRTYGSLRWKGRTVRYDEAAARLFGISVYDARGLFTASLANKERHKNILLNRIMRFLDDAGQITNLVIKPT